MAYTPPKGLERTEPGHRIVGETTCYPNPNYPTYKRDVWLCECGAYISGGLKASGDANSYLTRDWHGHLDAAGQNSLIVDIGTITKKRVSEIVQVMTADRAKAEGFTLSSWQDGANWVGVTTKTMGTKVTRKVVCAYSDKADVLWKTEDYLRKAEREGHAVEFLLESTIQESSEDATLRLMNLVDEALEDEDPHAIERAKEELDTFFKLLPIIEAKRTALEDLRTRRLLGRAS